jgi:hypothetical protein
MPFHKIDLLVCCQHTCISKKNIQEQSKRQRIRGVFYFDTQQIVSTTVTVNDMMTDLDWPTLQQSCLANVSYLFP